MIPSLAERRLYPSLAKEVYLNQASIGLIADPVVQTMHQFLDENARLGSMRLTDKQEFALFDRLRTPASRLLKCEPGNVAITACASDILGQLPFWFNLAEGEEVVLVETDFPAISRPWLSKTQPGAPTIRWVKDAPNTDLSQSIIDQISPRTRLIVVGHVQYGTGSLVQVPRVSARAAEVGAALIIDATQSSSMLDLNGPDWQVDAIITSGYKWLGGHGGVALSYLSNALVDRTPVLAGWMGAPEPFNFDAKRVPFADLASRFTMSTMSYLSITGLASALELGLEREPEATMDHTHRLKTYLKDALSTTGWDPYHQALDPSPIVSLGHPNVDGSDVFERLLNEGIHCSQRKGRLRISLAPFVNSEDLDRLVSILSLYN